MATDRVLVTGATGFVGRHVVGVLQARGYSVRALVHQRRELPPGVESVALDLARPSDLRDVVAGCAGIVHAAALLDPISDPEAAERVNHLATLELAQAAAATGARAFVFVSTQAAIGYHPGAGLLGSDAPCAPTTVYGRSKLAAERALAAASLGALRSVILRPPTVYGPGERRNFLALTRAVDSGVFAVPGRGDNRMSTCWVGNLADACAWALETRPVRGVVHVADEPVLSFRQLVETLAWALGRPLSPLPFPLPVARALGLVAEVAFGLAGKDPPLSRARLRTLTADSALDTSETRRLGFVPRVRFSDGVSRTVAWYRDEGLLRPR